MIATEQTLTGTTIKNWLKLLWKNKFRINIRYLHKFLLVNVMLAFTAPFIWYEKIRFTRKIKRTKIEKDPIFILGHWRSGTTYLHMLMTRDENFSYASNLQSFFPHIFLGSRRLFERILANSMPEKRRQDNFKLGPNQPSEEDFAIANTTQLSFYHGLAFPRRRRYYSRYITFEETTEKERTKWKKTYLLYLKKLTLASNGKQLVLKNPPNTARIKMLLELFPNAKFIHIHRNPYEVFPSTIKMYNYLVPPFFLQKPDVENAEKIVLDLYEEIHKKYFEERHLIPKENLIEVCYNEFLQDPLQIITKIYEQFSIEEFENVKPKIIEYIRAQRNYKTNKHSLTQQQRKKIKRKCKQSFKMWGYSTKTQS